MEQKINNLNLVLESLNIGAVCVAANQHRHLTSYDIKLNPTTRIKTIDRYAGEIALLLKCKSLTPTVTVVPEEGVVRITVAERSANVLEFGSIVKDARKPSGVLPILLGESNGHPLWTRMEKNPHIIVAGETGSGKTVLLHTIIANVIGNNDVWLYLIDPKHGLEFGCYSDFVQGLAENYDEAIAILEDLNTKMEIRYKFMNKIGIRSIEQKPDSLNKILVVIDEISSLMIWDSDKKNPNHGRFESLLVSLAQKSRAAGIYLVIATQRPSVDVITGLIKANFPARISCRVSSATDSRVILDSAGAETLIGKGDAIINSPEHGYVRFQSAFTTPEITLKSIAAA